MTGFGSASNYDFTVEVRSLNHRFIDISIKMPPYMGRHDIPLRNIIKEMFQRGRFDVFISANSDRAVPSRSTKDWHRISTPHGKPCRVSFPAWRDHDRNAFGIP
jgi:uncharacterized protein (TIGR00255 family)